MVLDGVGWGGVNELALEFLIKQIKENRIENYDNQNVKSR